MTSTTYDIFFTGRDDPRSCFIIGEDTKPIYFCFETTERNLLTPNLRTMVSGTYSNSFFFFLAAWFGIYIENFFHDVGL